LTVFVVKQPSLALDILSFETVHGIQSSERRFAQVVRPGPHDLLALCFEFFASSKSIQVHALPGCCRAAERAGWIAAELRASLADRSMVWHRVAIDIA
jgi:hypothetical protein